LTKSSSFAINSMLALKQRRHILDRGAVPRSSTINIWE